MNLKDVVERDEMKLFSMEQLFEVAEKYGNITMFSHNTDKTYKIKIEFETIPGIALTADSGYQTSITTALIEAMNRANQIRNQFK